MAQSVGDFDGRLHTDALLAGSKIVGRTVGDLRRTLDAADPRPFRPLEVSPLARPPVGASALPTARWAAPLLRRSMPLPSRPPAAGMDACCAAGCLLLCPIAGAWRLFLPWGGGGGGGWGGGGGGGGGGGRRAARRGGVWGGGGGGGGEGGLPIVGALPLPRLLPPTSSRVGTPFACWAAGGLPEQGAAAEAAGGRRQASRRRGRRQAAPPLQAPPRRRIAFAARWRRRRRRCSAAWAWGARRCGWRGRDGGTPHAAGALPARGGAGGRDQGRRRAAGPAGGH
jgi:hypothetical protein